MDPDKLEIRVEHDLPMPHFCTAYIAYGDDKDAPIVGVLYFDGEPLKGPVVTRDGFTIPAEEAVESGEPEHAGWLLWPVGERSGSIEDPRVPALAMKQLGPNEPPHVAVNWAFRELADRELPSFDYAASAEMIEDLLWGA